MFGRVWNFVKRHKRKFVFTGVFVGGVVLLGKYAGRKLREMQEEEAAEYLLAARRQHHFDSNQTTCNITVLSMLPTLKQALTLHLPCERLTDKLKENPPNKIEIWEELKIISLSRCVTAVYSSCMLVTLLRVQLNILGGYMYLDTLGTKNSAEGELGVRATADVQQRYLSCVQHLLSEGLVNLIGAVKKAVGDTIGSTSLKHQMSLPTIQQLLQAVRVQLECQDQVLSPQPTSALGYFILPADSDAGEQAGWLPPSDVFYSKLMRETRDIIESEDFGCVLTACLDTAFVRLAERISDYFSVLPEVNGTSSSVTLPLAKLIPVFSDLLQTICTDPPNPLIQELLLKEQLKRFAANVYEAFSQPERPGCKDIK